MNCATTNAFFANVMIIQKWYNKTHINPVRLETAPTVTCSCLNQDFGIFGLGFSHLYVR